jgi:hypothetical protein
VRSVKKATTIVAAVGAAALGVGLMGFGSGVGAVFTDSATGNASINVGTFGCQLSSSDPGVTIGHAGHTATVNLGTINSSAAGERTAPLTLTNKGSIPLVAQWDVDTTGGVIGGSEAITAIPAADSGGLNAGGTQDVNIGFSWAELGNADLNNKRTAVYTVNCSEAGTFGANWLFQKAGGGALWDGAAQTVTLTVPAGAADPTGAGINLLDVSTGSALPSTAPVFLTDTYSTGTPRLAIQLSNGSYAVGYPAQFEQSSDWELQGQYTTWAAVQDYVNANSLTVSSAFIVADASAALGSTNVITCVNYSGTPLLGNC